MSEDDGNVLKVIASFLDQAGTASDEKSHVLACAWTLQQIPQVQNDEQAQGYRRDAEALIQQWLNAGADETYDDFMRGRSGMLVSAYRARVGEWEAAQSKLSK